MEIRETPTAEAGMLIRRPVADVFEAFIDPAITTKFWFTHGSDRLDSGKEIHWEWRMYGVSTTVNISEIVEKQEDRHAMERSADHGGVGLYRDAGRHDLCRGPQFWLCRQPR